MTVISLTDSLSIMSRLLNLFSFSFFIFFFGGDT